MKQYSVLSVDGVVSNDAGNIALRNENNVYLSHEFLAVNGNDFVGISNVSSGTIGQSTANLTVNNPGIARVTSSTTANSGGAARSFSNVYILKSGEVFTEIINPLTFTNTTHRAGLHDSASSAIPNNGVYFEYSNSGVLTFVTADNGTRTTSATIATLAIITWYKVRFTVNSTATSVLAELFNASGVLIASVTQTTNIPTTARLLNVCSITTNSGTTATALIDVDFISLKTTLTR